MKNEDETIWIVKWGDAWARHGYYDQTDEHSPVIMVDIGWFVEENDETIVLCRSICEDDGQRRALSVIPICNIISIEELI